MLPVKTKSYYWCKLPPERGFMRGMEPSKVHALPRQRGGVIVVGSALWKEKIGLTIFGFGQSWWTVFGGEQSWTIFG
jgi:hypothetical protein